MPFKGEDRLHYIAELLHQLHTHGPLQLDDVAANGIVTASRPDAGSTRRDLQCFAVSLPRNRELILQTHEPDLNSNLDLTSCDLVHAVRLDASNCSEGEVVSGVMQHDWSTNNMFPPAAKREQYMFRRVGEASGSDADELLSELPSRGERHTEAQASSDTSPMWIAIPAAAVPILTLCLCAVCRCLRRRRQAGAAVEVVAPKREKPFVPADPGSFTENIFAGGNVEEIRSFARNEHWLLKPSQLQVDGPVEGSRRISRGRLWGVNEVAVKTGRPEEPEDYAALLHEVRVLRCVRHPAIVLFYGAVVEYQRGTYMQLVVEWVPGCSLREYVLQRRATHEFEAQVRQLREVAPRGLVHEHKMLLELVGALQYIHKNAIVHLSLRPERVLVDMGRVPPCAKLTNFSRAQMLYRREAQGPPDHWEADAFTAPELVQGTPASPGADVFSFGAVALYTLAAEEPPAEPGAAAARAAAVAGEDPAPLGSLAIGRPVVAACLATEPSQRPDLSAVYQDLLPAAS